MSVNQELSRLLRICIDFYNNALTIIQLKNFHPLLEKFDYKSQKSLALYLIMNMLEYETIIPTADEAEAVLNLLGPLLNGDTTPEGHKSDGSGEVIDYDEFAEEQGILAR